MHRFLLSSGTVFAIVATAWLFRLAMGFPIEVWGYSVPRWVSVIPMIVTGSLAIWAFRLAASGAAQPRT